MYRGVLIPGPKDFEKSACRKIILRLWCIHVDHLKMCNFPHIPPCFPNPSRILSIRIDPRFPIVDSRSECPREWNVIFKLFVSCDLSTIYHFSLWLSYWSINWKFLFITLSPYHRTENLASVGLKIKETILEHRKFVLKQKWPWSAWSNNYKRKGPTPHLKL